MKLKDILKESSIINEGSIEKALKMRLDYKEKLDKLDDIIDKAKDERRTLVGKEKGNYRKELKKVIDELGSELKKLGINNRVYDSADYTLIEIQDIAKISVGNRFVNNGNGKLAINFEKSGNNKFQVLKPNTSIKDIAQLIKKNT